MSSGLAVVLVFRFVWFLVGFGQVLARATWTKLFFTGTKAFSDPAVKLQHQFLQLCRVKFHFLNIIVHFPYKNEHRNLKNQKNDTPHNCLHSAMGVVVVVVVAAFVACIRVNVVRHICVCFLLGCSGFFGFFRNPFLTNPHWFPAMSKPR